MYAATLQVQLKHDSLQDFNTDYSYTMAGSLIYKRWEDIRMGTSFAYGKFNDIPSQMQTLSIDGHNFSPHSWTYL